MDMNKKHNKDGFRVPENYFGELEERLRDRTALEEIMPKGEGFAVPDRYFEQFESKLQNRLATDRGKIRYLHHAKTAMAVAASITGVIFLSTLLFNNTGEFSFDQVETTDIEWLMEQGSLEVPETFLVEQAASINLNELSMNTHLVNTKTLEDYLLDEIDVYEVLNDSI